MGHIKEPIGVDFIIQSSPLTDIERKEISEYIKLKKEQNRKQQSKSIRKQTKQTVVAKV
jgi:hypothetical protein